MLATAGNSANLILNNTDRLHRGLVPRLGLFTVRAEVVFYIKTATPL